MTQTETNIKIRDREPKVYFADVVKQTNGGELSYISRFSGRPTGKLTWSETKPNFQHRAAEGFKFRLNGVEIYAIPLYP